MLFSIYRTCISSYHTVCVGRFQFPFLAFKGLRVMTLIQACVRKLHSPLFSNPYALRVVPAPACPTWCHFWNVLHAQLCLSLLLALQKLSPVFLISPLNFPSLFIFYFSSSCFTHYIHRGQHLIFQEEFPVCRFGLISQLIKPLKARVTSYTSLYPWSAGPTGSSWCRLISDHCYELSLEFSEGSHIFLYLFKHCLMSFSFSPA